MLLLAPVGRCFGKAQSAFVAITEPVRVSARRLDIQIIFIYVNWVVHRHRISALCLKDVLVTDLKGPSDLYTVEIPFSKDDGYCYSAAQKEDVNNKGYDIVDFERYEYDLADEAYQVDPLWVPHAFVDASKERHC